jgi:hypothetical protein
VGYVVDAGVGQSVGQEAGDHTTSAATDSHFIFSSILFLLRVENCTKKED